MHPRTGQVVGQLDAREVFRKIVHGAWKTGEPGVFFIDRANQYNPVPRAGQLRGDQPVRRAAAARPTTSATSAPSTSGCSSRTRDVDWDALRAAVHLCTHFLDNVIDANKYPLDGDRRPRQADPPHRSRHHGVGRPAGAARHPLQLGRGRGAGPQADAVRGRGVEGRVREAGRGARCRSPNGSARSGVPTRPARATRRATASARCAGLRNCNLTTVAPTGTISIIAGLQLGHRAAVRGGVHAQPGGRADARRERGLRRHRQARRLVLRRADAAHRRERPHPLPRGAGGGAARVRDGARRHPGVAHPHAGRLPGVHRLGDLQDLQLPATRRPRTTSSRSTGWRSS